jgi:thioredoxin 1
MADHVFTQENFKAEVLDSDKLVLIDFWAPWCGPCRVASPIVDRVAETMKDRAIKVGKLNVDENQDISQQFGIMSIPTFLFFKGGKVVEQIVGVPSEAGLKAKIESHLS